MTLSKVLAKGADLQFFRIAEKSFECAVSGETLREITETLLT